MRCDGEPQRAAAPADRQQCMAALAWRGRGCCRAVAIGNRLLTDPSDRQRPTGAEIGAARWRLLAPPEIGHGRRTRTGTRTTEAFESRVTQRFNELHAIGSAVSVAAAVTTVRASSAAAARSLEQPIAIGGGRLLSQPIGRLIFELRPRRRRASRSAALLGGHKESLYPALRPQRPAA